MFIVQPAACFGDVIAEQLTTEKTGRRRWRTFEFAVAWANSAGVEKISESARAFLAEGGCIRATVGLDFSSTSYEGLSKLLKLEAVGADITTNVFFDENRSCTFHPKIFLFSNAREGRLFVGSNNMTGAGFETNMEATLAVTGLLKDKAIRTASETLASWRDSVNESRTKRLTVALLDTLRELGYVRTEEQIRQQRSSEASSMPTREKRLFGRSASRPSMSAHKAASRASGTGSGCEEVLLMRIRKRRNGNQIQISKKVLNGSFMNGATEVVFADGTHRTIGSNTARGIANTERFEAPGLRDMTNPVARFRWLDGRTASDKPQKQLIFELFDADLGGLGAEIFRKLKHGLTTPPLRNLEQLNRLETRISAANLANAQWYRLDVTQAD